MTRSDPYEHMLARSVDAVGDDMDVCPECEGSGYSGPTFDIELGYGIAMECTPRCERCGGSGCIEVEYDAMDDGDRAYDASTDA